MSIFVYDYDHNAPTVEYYRETHERMFKIIREANPDLPIIYAGGVGEPGHSTDYVCAVKSLEHSCDIYFAKFGCDGVYDRDPNGKDGANAVFYPEVSFARIEAEGLKVIDLEAAQLLQKPASDGELCRGYIFALTAENISAMLCGKADDLRKTVLA